MYCTRTALRGARAVKHRAVRNDDDRCAARAASTSQSSGLVAGHAVDYVSHSTLARTYGQSYVFTSFSKVHVSTHTEWSLPFEIYGRVRVIQQTRCRRRETIHSWPECECAVELL